MSKRRAVVLMGIVTCVSMALFQEACVSDEPPSATLDDGGSDAAEGDATLDAGSDVGAADGSSDVVEAAANDAGVVAPPRPVAPLSTSHVTSQRPTLTWVLPTVVGVDGAWVEICKDRACATVESSFAATGTSGKPAAALAPGAHFWRLRAMRGTLVATNTSPTWEMFVGHHDAPHATSFGTVADFNGDGIADMAVGGFYGPSLRVFSGAASLGAKTLVPNPDPDGGLLEQFAVVASVGDLDGDGYPELAVGSYNYNNVGSGGHVYLYKGGAGGTANGAAPTVALPPPAGANGGVSSQFGQSVAAAGDVDGDGYADVIVGADELNSENDAGTQQFGGAVLYSGGPSAMSNGPTRSVVVYDTTGNDCRFGHHVASAGDVDGDGFDDVLITAYGCPYDNFLFYGGTTGIHYGHHVNLTAVSGSYVENAVPHLPGDLNGDGYPDVVIGVRSLATLADGGPEPGHVLVYVGGAGGVAATPSGTLAAPFDEAAFGKTLGIASDVDGDGYDDLIVGAPDGVGAAYCFTGSSGGVGVSAARRVDLPPPISFGGSNPWASAVEGVGDVNADGIDDVAITATTADDVYVFTGATGASPGLAAARWTKLGIAPSTLLPSLAMVRRPTRARFF